MPTIHILLFFVLLVIGLLCIFFFCPDLVYNIIFSALRFCSKLRKKSITLDNHIVYYLEGRRGEDRETVLLLHGLGGDKDNWVRFAKKLTNSYHVVAIDLPGFGESRPVDSQNYSIKSQVKILSNVITELGIKKLHIAGNSMGGAVAGLYSLEHPDKVLSLALLDTYGLECSEKSELEKYVGDVKAEIDPDKLIFKIKNMKDYDRFLDFVFHIKPFMPDPVKIHNARQSIALKNTHERIFYEILDEKGFLNDRLKDIKVRTLVIWGMQDRIISRSCLCILKENLSDVKAVEIEDCGHSPMIEKPEKTSEIYLEFLNG